MISANTSAKIQSMMRPLLNSPPKDHVNGALSCTIFQLSTDANVTQAR